MPDDITTPTPSPTDSTVPVSDAPISTTPISDGPSVPTPSITPPSPSPSVVTPTPPSSEDSSEDSPSEILSEVARKIDEAHNVLIALSSDPSVDEMAAAIGLSLFLDKLGKRATAIYSGETPNALEFLKPEETFESTADTLQDFVIALNKDKADHLRYKLDGDYVKIYITPYRTRINEDDLDFSYGDFNVDLVLALDVSNGIDLDSALREHGRIMHDAIIINITTGNPGKFGEIEWSDKSASSVSEMIAKLLYGMGNRAKIEKEEATALLTGIVAATNRFSNAKTTPNTMKISSKLMESGANQQLVSKNITPDVDNEMHSLLGSPKKPSPDDQNDPTKLNIKHGAEAESSKEDSDKESDTESDKTSREDSKSESEGSTSTTSTPEDKPDNDNSQNNEPKDDEPQEISGTITEKESTLLDDLKAAEASLAQTGTETMEDHSHDPIRLEDVESNSNGIKPSNEQINSLSDDFTPTSDGPKLPPVVEDPTITPPTPSAPSAPPEPTDIENKQQEKVIAPDSNFSLETSQEESDKYGKMLEDALANVGAPSTTSTSSGPQAFAMDDGENPATSIAPSVPTNPDINGVPSINYMPMPGEEVLPPPPTPPIDLGDDIAPGTTPASAPAPVTPPVAPVEPAGPAVEPEPTSLGSQPSMQDQVYTPQASDPAAFKIPGM